MESKTKKILNYLLLLVIGIVPFNIEKNIRGVWITSTDVLIVFLFILWLILILKNKEQIEFKKLPLFPLIIALIITFLASSLNSINIFLTLKETVKFILIFAFFYLLVYNLNNKFSLNLLPKIITICAFIVSVWFVIDFLFGKVTLVGIGGRTWYRIFGPYTHLNSLGTYLTITIPFGFFHIFVGDPANPAPACRGWAKAVTRNKLRYKLIFFPIIIIQMIALFLTYSRSNWLAIGSVLFLYLLFRYKIRGILYFVIFIFISFVLGSFFTSSSGISKRFLSTFDSKELSILDRKEHLQTAVLMIKKYPLTGVGLGNFQLAAKKYFNKDLTEMAHNIFLHYGSEAGIFSMVILLIIIMKYFWDTFAIYKKLPNDGFFRLLPRWNNASSFRTAMNPTVSSPIEKMSRPLGRGFLRGLLSCSAISFLGLFISAQFGDPFVRNTKEFFALLLALPYAVKLNADNKNTNING